MKKQDENNENLITEITDDQAIIQRDENFAENAPAVENKADLVMGYKDDENNFIMHKTSSHHVKSVSKSKKKKKKKKKSKVKKVLLIILLVILGIIVAIAVTFGILYYTGESDLTDKSEIHLVPPDEDTTVIDNGNYINYNGHVYRYKDSMTSILFMGIDKEELGTVDNIVGTGGQADALYLVAIDTDNGLTKTFQISRNTMCDINLYNDNGDFLSTQNAQVCMSYAYGDGKETSAENTITSVRRIFYGLPVAQSYVALDIEGITAINDSIGGVTVTSPVDLGDTYKAGESYELYGKDAEKFVRTRDLSQLDSNTNRMERQKAYINAFIDKLVSMTKNNISAPVDVYNAATPYTVNNLTASKVSYLSVDLLRKGITSAGIEKVPGVDKEGKEYTEYEIDNDKFFEMIVDTFYVQAD
jgi:LCP family protein required for cell wall assembly